MLDKPAYFLAFAASVTLLFVVLSRAAARLITKARDAEEHNVARAILEAGRLFGVVSVSGAVVTGCVHGESVTSDVIWVLIYGSIAIVLQEILAAAGVRVLVRSRLPEEIASGNIAAGIAGGAHYAATGIIISQSFAGDDLKTLGISMLFLVIAQITLHGFVILFRAITSYDDGEEILNENIAAALSYAGMTIALGIIIGHALEGEYRGLALSLRGYALSLVFALALYPVRQIVVQLLICRGGFSLRGGKLDRAIASERNVGIGTLEAVSYLATAFLVTRLR